MQTWTAQQGTQFIIYPRTKLYPCDQIDAIFQIIVPPSWIVKVPTSQSFKSSLKASPLKAKNGKTFKMVENNTDENSNQSDDKPKNSIKDFFCVKPIPETSVTPILVFLNPKSGGNQGVKLMQKFQCGHLIQEIFC